MKTAVLLRSVDGNWNWLTMTKIQDLFPGQSNIMTHFSSGIIACMLLFDVLFYTHQPLCMIEFWKQAFVNISMSPLFLILSFASGSSKTTRVSQKLFNPVDSRSAIEMYFYLYMGNSCIVLSFCETYSCDSSWHFEWGHSRQNLGLPPTYSDFIPEWMLHQSNLSQ